MLEAASIAEDAKITTVVVAAPDVLGRLFGRWIPRRRFLESADETYAVCSGALAWDVDQLPVKTTNFGEHRGWGDVFLKPDPSALFPFPGLAHAVVCFADIVDAEGNEVASAPRTLLREQTANLANRGYTARVASELEFYVLPQHDSDRASTLDLPKRRRLDYDISAPLELSGFFHQLEAELSRVGIHAASIQAEYGHGQWEIGLEHCEPCEMADKHVMYKLAVKECARQHGLRVTFMAKPIPDDNGSSCHVHCSLYRRGENALVDPSRDTWLSLDGQRFVAGLLRRLPETALCFAPHVNSYRRLLSLGHQGEFMPAPLTWGYDNRSVLVRVVGRHDACRVEHRYAGADANPYVMITALLAAGLDGMIAEHPLVPPTEGDAFADSSGSLTPESLGAAIALFAASSFAAETFGEAAVQLLALAQREWLSFLSSTTEWDARNDIDAH